MDLEENLEEVVVENEDVVSDADLQYFIESDNLCNSYSEYENVLLTNLY
jgi:hypothetical protein